MGAVSGSESVHHEDISQTGPFFGQGWVILLFALLITGVLDEKDLAVFEIIDGFLEFFPAGGWAEMDWGAWD